MTVTVADLAKLQGATPATRVQWRGDTVSKDGTRIRVLAYVDGRYVQDVLDLLGSENWQNRYEDCRDGTRCGIGIKLDGEWVWKWDAADASDIEAVKGAHSGAMKRAGVQWGIGRDLYDLPDVWVRAEEYRQGKFRPAVMPVFVDGQWVDPERVRPVVSQPVQNGPGRPEPARVAPVSIGVPFMGVDPHGTDAGDAWPDELPQTPAGRMAAEPILPMREDICEEHNLPWKGVAGDMYHRMPEGGYHRHERNTPRSMVRA